MLADNEVHSLLFLEASKEQREERKKRILVIPIVILSVIASLAWILNVGMNRGYSSTPIGVSHYYSTHIDNGLTLNFLRWHLGWKVIIVGKFRAGCGFSEHSSSWDPVVHTIGYCNSWNNITGVMLTYDYQVDTTYGIPGDFLINEIPYTLFLNGTKFLIKEIDETVIVQQVDKDLSFLEDLFDANAYDDIQLLGTNDADIAALYQDDALDDDAMKL